VYPRPGRGGQSSPVDDRTDRPDLPLDNVEREHADDPAIWVEQGGAGLTVHRQPAQTDAAQEVAHAPPAAHGLSCLRPAEDRLFDRRHVAAAVAVQLDVLGEQGLERLEVALPRMRRRSPSQPLALLGGGLEAWPPLLNVTPGARG
jgi:hypothetical protein